MRYAFQLEADGARNVYVFGDEAKRIKWIAANPIHRGILSANSREVKSALYRGTEILVGSRDEAISAPDRRGT
jgi:hypothetical protein